MLKSTVSGVHQVTKTNAKVKLRKSRWEKILWEWCHLTDQCSRVLGPYDDASYWYNEAGNVSIVAAACFRAGLVGLTETKGGKISKDSESGEKQGRYDLYVMDEEIWECVEAKSEFCEIGRLKSSFTNLRERAIEDAKNSSRYSEDNGVAMTFIIPFIKKTDEVDFEDSITNIVKEALTLGQEKKVNFLAYCFPKDTRQITDNRHFYPGVILIIDWI